MDKKIVIVLVGMLVMSLALLAFFPGYLGLIRQELEEDYHVFDLSEDGSCKVATIQWHNNFPELINIRNLDNCALDFYPFSEQRYQYSNGRKYPGSQSTTKIHTEQLGTITVSKNPTEIWQWRDDIKEHPLEFSGHGPWNPEHQGSYAYFRTCVEGTKYHCLKWHYGNWGQTCEPYEWTYIGKAGSKEGIGIHLTNSEWKVEYFSGTPPQGDYKNEEFTQIAKPLNANLKNHTILSDEYDLLHYYTAMNYPQISWINSNYPSKGLGQKECATRKSNEYWLYNPSFFAEEERLKNEKERTIHVKLFECPVPDRYIYQIETFSSDFTLKDFMFRPSYFCTLEPMKIHTRLNEVKYNMSLLEDLVDGKTITVTPGDKYFVTYVVSEENMRCGVNEIRSCAGYCHYAMQTCIDNNLDGECDATEPVLWVLDMNDNREIDNEDQICSDRDGDSICDCVVSLFCYDNDENGICDWDEFKYAATSCKDLNNNNICDEKETTSCADELYAPVCGIDNITYPNECSINEFGIGKMHDGKCLVAPIIIRKDCTSSEMKELYPPDGCPTGYLCAPAAGQAGGACIRTEIIYQETFIDCRIQGCDENHICSEVGPDYYVCEYKNTEYIDCLTKGCPKPSDMCIGGICLREEKVIGRCPEDIDCSQYDCSWTDAYGGIHEQPCVCNEYIGLCMQERYKLTTCDQPEVDCEPGFICVGKTCISEDELYKYCQDSSECMEGFECFNNKCMKIGICPETPCPPGTVCVNHKCIPKGDIAIVYGGIDLSGIELWILGGMLVLIIGGGIYYFKMR